MVAWTQLVSIPCRHLAAACPDDSLRKCLLLRLLGKLHLVSRRRRFHFQLQLNCSLRPYTATIMDQLLTSLKQQEINCQRDRAKFMCESISIKSSSLFPASSITNDDCRPPFKVSGSTVFVRRATQTWQWSNSLLQGKTPGVGESRPQGLQQSTGPVAQNEGIAHKSLVPVRSGRCAFLECPSGPPIIFSCSRVLPFLAFSDTCFVPELSLLVIVAQVRRGYKRWRAVNYAQAKICGEDILSMYRAEAF